MIDGLINLLFEEPIINNKISYENIRKIAAVVS